MRLVYMICVLLVLGVSESVVAVNNVDAEANPAGNPNGFVLAAPKVKISDKETKAGTTPDYVEYLYGVGAYDAYLVKVDHVNNTVASASLFPIDLGPCYGAAGSGSPDYFWATRISFTEQGQGSLLEKVYPSDKIVVPVGNGYGQNPRYPNDPNYVINIRELAYNDDTDVLYGTDYLGLYSIDTTSGTASYIGDFGNGVDSELIDNVFSMGYDTDTMSLYIANQKIADDGVTRLSTHLYTVDMETAEPLFIGDTVENGITDIYQSETSGLFFGAANLDNRIVQVDTSTGAAAQRGEIAGNLLGLGDDFLEVPGPQVWFPSAGGRPSVTVFSKLNGAFNNSYDIGSSGRDTSCSAAAFVQQQGQPDGTGQQTDIYSRLYFDHDSLASYIDIEVDFDSVYNGTGASGTGGATVEVNWSGTLRIMSDEVYPFGTRVLVLVDGEQLLNDLTSNYVFDWEMTIHDPDINDPVMLLTDEDVPGLDSSPLLGAFFANVGGSSSYSHTYQVNLTMNLDIDMLPGDANEDGRVDIFDFEKVAAAWLVEDCSGDSWCSGSDINEDSSVDLLDLSSLASDWLQGKTWNSYNSFNLDMSFVFRSVAVPGTPQMLNDECEDAVTVVPGVEYFGTTRDATGTDISSCNYNDAYDLWYKFIPQTAGVYKVYVENAGPESINPCVSIFAGCGGTELYCWESWVDNRFFAVDEWTEYYIRIADSNYSVGDFKFVLEYYPSPGNDSCDNPLPVYLYDYIEGNTFAATNDSFSNCGDADNADVWYYYTAEESGNVAIVLEPYDFISYNVSVFTNSCDEGSRLELACANGNEMGETPVTAVGFNAAEGETYLIRVAANYDQYGEFAMYIEPGPENDLCQDAIELTLWDSEWNTTLGASGTGMTSSCGTDDVYDVWYKYTADNGQMIMFEVFDDSGMGYPLTVSVYSDCDGFELACSQSPYDCFEGGCYGQAIYNISAGETVYVRVAYNDFLTGSFQINVNEIYPPENDECENAEVLEEWAEGNTRGSSGSAQSSCGYSEDLYDVWYIFTPSETVEYSVFIETYEMPFQGTLSIYEGSCDTGLNEIACSDIYGYGEIYETLQQDQTYYIRVASYEGTQTEFGLVAISGFNGDN